MPPLSSGPQKDSKELLPSDNPIKTREDICTALKVYGHCLLDVQREALENYCFAGLG